MVLKPAENNEAQITILENLLRHERISADKKHLIQKELSNILKGAATEKQAAYEVDFYFGLSKNFAVLHDLRLEIKGRVAQIDHLIISRFLEVFVLETKTFSTGLTINDRGEFSMFYDGREFGIESPIEQNARHIIVLRDAFKEIGLPTRLGITLQPSFHPVVLVSPKAVINRPTSTTIDTSTIMKLDQFSSWHDKKIDETKAIDALGIFKICSANTVKELGEKLAGLHKPGRIDYIRKFDLTDSLLGKNAQTSVPSISASPPQAGRPDKVSPNNASNYFCATCRKPVADVVAKFCWNNKSKFGGKAYCRACQSKF